MGAAEGVAAIAEHPFLRGLAPSLLDALVPVASVRSFAPDEFLFREGDPADRFFLLRSGKVALEIGGSGLPPKILQTLGPGELLGWSWLLPPFRWRLDARVLKGGTAFALEAASTRDTLTRHPEHGLAFVLRVLPIVGERLEHARLQLMDLYAR